MAEIEFFHLTDTGCVRDGNEDAIGCWPHDDGLVFAVADGLGGHTAGEFASTLALEVLARELEGAPRSWAVAKRLHRSVQEANLQIHNKSVTVPELRGMATTLTATAVVGSTLAAAHVGDCRLYLLREGAFTQLTKDHTWVWEQVAYGILSPEEARTHPRRNILSRCLGPDLIVGIDVLTMEAHRGDVLVQCSDGIHTLIGDDELAEAARTGQPDAACRHLIRRGREEGGLDNLSVQVAAIIECAPPERRWWRLGR